MKCLRALPPPQSEEELLQRCQTIAGLSFSQLCAYVGVQIPEQESQRKGWIGQVIEQALGADGKNLARPDFQELGIELKTLPLSARHIPSESTFITTIPLLTIHQESWENSSCFAKLKRVLWLPVEGDATIPYAHRRIGQAFLWSPVDEDLRILKEDWIYLTSQIVLGCLDELDATVGTYLQIRPKGANGKSLCYAFDREGNKVKTLPRGFYLRSRFTAMLLNQVNN
ncbi:MAG: DNA mismatch repair endonuclease MutH [Legionella sp. 40-6]|nr:DNA mismatch repair endonuclease MutH [Legionella sp.]OJX90171.1 MAG: DNA mismatch repair endonuclease MutH [Legionella sp. 40-6]